MKEGKGEKSERFLKEIINISTFNNIIKSIIG